MSCARRQIADVHGDLIIVEPVHFLSSEKGAVVQLRIRYIEPPDAEMDGFPWAGNAEQLRELITTLEAFEQRAK